MEALRRKVEKLRYQNENAYGRHFVPHDELQRLMTEDNVRNVLEDSSMKRYSIDETTETIVKRAYRIFSILVLIGHAESILVFIMNDGHRQLSIDDRLPFSLNMLQEIFSDDIVTKKFNEKQKEFTVPIFDRSALPRYFKGGITLPFLEDHHIGSGGFGNVQKINISPSHQLYGLSSEWFVRKEIRTESSEDDFEKELHNLSRLETAPPSEYRRAAWASDENLDEVVQNERLPYLQSNKDYLVPLTGLGSAICATHEYSSRNLRAIGCHHDLRPSNVLVEISKSLLAGFGLSRLRVLPQTSATFSKDARRDYLAPECEDLGADCEKHIIHRSSDIWSFGCIIVELLTYMIKAPRSVKEFEAKRAFNVRGVALWRFHCGLGNPSKAVVDWMEWIKSQCYRPKQQLALPVKDMVSIRPEDRPRAPVVKEKLCAIAIGAITQTVDRSYTKVSQKSLSLQVFVERKKFTSWKWACGLTMVENGPAPVNQYEWGTYDSFQSVLYHLSDVQNTLRTFESNYQMSRILLPLQLRKINHDLFEMLPQRLQDEATNLWEHSLLDTTDDRSTLLSRVLADFASTRGNGSSNGCRITMIVYLLKYRNNALNNLPSSSSPRRWLTRNHHYKLTSVEIQGALGSAYS